MCKTAMHSSNPYVPAQGERRGGTVGNPLLGVGLRTRDDEGHQLPSGAIGTDGAFTIFGRSKDLIINGGYNLCPAEIQGHIDKMPSVPELAVVGVHHSDFGEAAAVVVRKPGPALAGSAIGAEVKTKISNSLAEGEKSMSTTTRRYSDPRLLNVANVRRFWIRKASTVLL